MLYVLHMTNKDIADVKDALQAAATHCNSANQRRSQCACKTLACDYLLKGDTGCRASTAGAAPFVSAEPRREVDPDVVDAIFCTPQKTLDFRRSCCSD